jgi:hypothetical protein
MLWLFGVVQLELVQHMCGLMHMCKLIGSDFTSSVFGAADCTFTAVAAHMFL